MGTPVTGAGGASAAPGTSSKVTVSMRPVYGVDGVTPFVGRPLSIGMLRSSPFERSLEKLRVFWQEKDFVRFAAPKVRVCLSVCVRLCGRRASVFNRLRWLWMVMGNLRAGCIVMVV
jgi:hypothetical protein